MDEMEKLWESTGEAHSQIQTSYYDLLDLARQVQYLHPDMARHLRTVACAIESARATIQCNAAEQVNLQIKQQTQASANLLVTMLDMVK